MSRVPCRPGVCLPRATPSPTALSAGKDYRATTDDGGRSGCDSALVGAVLAEVAHARAVRSLARCVEAVRDAASPGCPAAVADAAPVVLALLAVERLAAGPFADPVDAAP